MALGLGPVARLADYDPAWPRRYEEEKTRIITAIGPWTTGIEHVGSTAVPGLAAKPILDILVGLGDLDDTARCIRPMQGIGYGYVPQYEQELPMRRYFRKGPVEHRTHHVHMVVRGTPFWIEHVRFRDWLRAHPTDAYAYERLKRDLAARFDSDREAYTRSKSDFIHVILRRAETD